MASLGTNMHWPEKHVLLVQLRPSSQSVFSQHWAQSPPQHLSEPGHLGEASQVPSGLQRSVVQMFPSSQSSGPLQVALALAPAPASGLPPLLLLSLPPVLVAPAWLPVSLAVKASPPQPLVQIAGSRALTSAKNTNLGLKKLTAILLGKASAARSGGRVRRV